MVTLMLRGYYGLFCRVSGQLLFGLLAMVFTMVILQRGEHPEISVPKVIAPKKVVVYEASDPRVEKVLATLLPTHEIAAKRLLQLLQQYGLLGEGVKFDAEIESGIPFLKVEGKVLTNYAVWAGVLDAIRKELPLAQLQSINVVQDEMQAGRYLIAYRLRIPLQKGGE